MFVQNTEELFGLLDEWQERLGLRDWYIDVAICSTGEMGDKENLGEVSVDRINKTACIRILREEDYALAEMFLKQPHEEVLIHELLHLKFTGFDEKNREEAYFELMQHQTLESIARALYAAKYNLSSRWYIANSNRHNASH